MLLGAGESGKSTIFKQMKILYGDNSMTQEDKNLIRSIIHNNNYKVENITQIQFTHNYVVKNNKQHVNNNPRGLRHDDNSEGVLVFFLAFLCS